MADQTVHETASFLAVRLDQGNNVFVRARWSTDQGALQEPPTVQRTGLNYVESPEALLNVALSAANPYRFMIDAGWWSTACRVARVIFVVVETRPNAANSAWVRFDSHRFIVNHDPKCNAGPDQRINLTATGAVPVDVLLDATRTTDSDSTAAVMPSTAVMTYRWDLEDSPPAMNAAGIAGYGAMVLDLVAQPTWLTAGDIIPATDRGSYRFRCTVHDQEVTTAGAMIGRDGKASATTHVLLGAGGPNLTIDSPSQSDPVLVNRQDGVSIRILYTIGDVIAANPTYAGVWMLRFRIRQAIPSPVAYSGAVGDIVFQETVTSYSKTGALVWDGVANAYGPGAVQVGPFLPCTGAFDVTLELLDGNSQPTGVAGNSVTVERAIVIDSQRWMVPLNLPTLASVALTGAFMETGHAGQGATMLHGGIDIGRGGGAVPDILAARSGHYSLSNRGAANAHLITLDHARPDTTRYLHGVPHTIGGVVVNDGQLVMQGTPIAQMSDRGTAPGSVHLHLQHHVRPLPGLPNLERLDNPLRTFPLPDSFSPTIEAVFIRQATFGGNAALANAKQDITATADLIVRCRDRAHPTHNSALGVFLACYGFRVSENGVPWAREFRLDTFDATMHASDFYAQEGHGPYGAVAAVAQRNHYLPYLRWSTNGYARQGGPRSLTVTAFDISGRISAPTQLVIGPEAVLRMPPPNPGATTAAPQPINLELEVIAHIAGLGDGAALATDDCHIEMLGAPAGWTVSPARTGALANGVITRVPIIIDPRPRMTVGTHSIVLAVSSHILRDVGVHVNVPITIT